MVINGFISDNLDIKIILGIKMRKDDFHFKREIINGRILPSILLRGYRGTYFGKLAPQKLSQNPFSIFFSAQKLIFVTNFHFFRPKNRHFFFTKNSVIFLDPPLDFSIFRPFLDFLEKLGFFENLRVFEVPPRGIGGHSRPVMQTI